MFDLKGKIAIVTGSRRGIGRGIAERLAYAGANVVISDIDQKECEKTAKEIAQMHKVETLAVKCDISKKAEVENLVKKTVERFGRLDIMVNNAGVYFRDNVADAKEEDVNKIIDVNLKGTFFGIQAASQEMKKKKYGKIVNIASVAGIVGFDGIAAYCASKGGIVNLTRAAALDLAGHGINVNCVAPGLIETPMTEFLKKDKSMLDERLAQIPKKRIGEPSDIANAVHFLVSDEADYVLGQILAVDGGWKV